ncbi:hypothetical protein SAMN05216390_1056 [Lachnospiraceae bacterium KH1T2]|nr:hypothetical protein SAMN05216390_1056 [Lachnospiraceae bacterium KH1T2]
MLNLDIRTCKKCHTIFQYVGYGSEVLCPRCYKEDNELFEKARKFLYENPGANLKVVADHCEIDIKVVQRWIEEGRLEFASTEGAKLKCIRCGASIFTGRFCKKCKKDLVTELSTGNSKKENKFADLPGDKMERAKRVAREFLKK